MKIEDQVCTLEQAIKLDKLGLKAESLFYWWRWDIPEAGDSYTLCTAYELEHCKDNPMVYPEWYSAFTVAELGIMLPKGYCSGNGVLSDEVKWCDKIHFINDDIVFLNDAEVTSGPTEAIARAAMLIKLIEI
jgi:hypothetical protein